jgi:mono/diheme cytochrome c family protein
MRRLATTLLVALGLGSGLWPGPIVAQDADRQVAQGEAIYARRCARCHGEGGEGKMGPSLIGAKHHLSGYGTADVLFDYTRQVMPADRPGRMLEVEYWAVLAYILHENDLLPSGTILEAATAPEIALDQ